MSVGQAVMLGAAGGLGLALLGWGLHPPRPSLATALAALRRPAPTAATDPTSRWRRRAAAPLHRLGLPNGQSLTDLALMQRDPLVHLAGQVTMAAAGLAVMALAGLVWGHGNLAVPTVAALAGAGGGLWLAELRLRAEAATYRAELVHTLGALLDLITVSLAGGAGVEQALSDATSVAQGRAAARIRAALDTARLTRVPPWQTLRHLGEQAGVAELEELAAALSLAGNEGARVRASLAARAHALRTRQTIAMQAQANAATERMTLPLMMLGAAFMIFLLYPAVTLMGGVL